MTLEIRPAPRPLFTLLILSLLTVAALPERALANDPTVYKIRNRWLSKEFLGDINGIVVYGTGEDANFQWTLEEVKGLQRIVNRGTHGYAVVIPAHADVTTTKAPPADGTGDWDIDSGNPPWGSIRNQANGKYLNCEHKLGHVECNGTDHPGGDRFWSGQWEFVHVGGPPPPRHYRNRQVAVIEPAYGATLVDQTTIVIRAPGLTSAIAKCWKQGDGFGADSTVATMTLDAAGNGSFLFPAKDYPHGPIMVRIIGTDGKATGTDGKAADTCNLQLYNTVGVKWNEGIPDALPRRRRE